MFSELRDLQDIYSNALHYRLGNQYLKKLGDLSKVRKQMWQSWTRAGVPASLPWYTVPVLPWKMQPFWLLVKAGVFFSWKKEIKFWIWVSVLLLPTFAFTGVKSNLLNEIKY